MVGKVTQTTLLQFFKPKTQLTQSTSTVSTSQKRLRSPTNDRPFVSDAVCGYSPPTVAATTTGAPAMGLTPSSDGETLLRSSTAANPISNPEALSMCAGEDSDLELGDLLNRLPLETAAAGNDGDVVRVKGCWLRSQSPTTDRDSSNTVRAPPPPPAEKKSQTRAPALTQTYLDLGQTAVMQVGTTCALCGMLFTQEAEDLLLHRRLCRRLQPPTTAGGRRRGPCSKAKDPSSDEPSAFAPASVSVLEGALRHLSRHVGNGAPGCERLLSDPLCPRLGDTTYILRCGKLAVLKTPGVADLIQLLGFHAALLEAIDYTVVALVSKRWGRVLCAVAGRPRTREQDPQLVLRPRPDGTTQYFTRKEFTFCDVDYVWLAPVAAVQRHDAAFRTNLLAFSGPFANFFASNAAKEETRAQDHQRVASELYMAFHDALVALANQVIYGHPLDPVSQLSFSASIFEASHTDSSATKEGIISQEMLRRCLGGHHARDGGDDALPAIFIHATEDSDDSQSDELSVSQLSASRLSVVSYTA